MRSTNDYVVEVMGAMVTAIDKEAFVIANDTHEVKGFGFSFEFKV